MRNKSYIWLIIAAVFMLAGLLAGCKSTVYVPVHSTSTEYRDRLVKDSVYLLDSVFLYSKNDTVFLNKYRYLYRDKLVRDTVNHTDSIRVPYPVVEYREVNKMYWWQKALMYLGCIFAVFLIYKLKWKQ